MNADDFDDFDGTLVLEQLAGVDRLDAFMDAVDADDLDAAATLLRAAGVDPRTITVVLEKMRDPGSH